MPAVIPVLVTIGNTVYTINAMVLIKAAILAGMVIHGQLQQRKIKRQVASDRKDLQIVLQSGIEPHRTVYGRAKLSGALAYAHSSGAGEGADLHRVVVLTGHEIDAYEKLYFNDDELEFQNSPLPASAFARIRRRPSRDLAGRRLNRPAATSSPNPAASGRAITDCGAGLTCTSTTSTSRTFTPRSACRTCRR
jgi:hypothetical protein